MISGIQSRQSMAAATAAVPAAPTPPDLDVNRGTPEPPSAPVASHSSAEYIVLALKRIGGRLPRR